MSVLLVTPPTDKPISVEDAREHCRLDADLETSYLATCIAAATAYAETQTGRPICQRGFEWRRDTFPCDDEDWQLRIPRPPLVAVTGFTYVDEAGATQTLAASVYEALDANAPILPGRLVLKPQQSWPSTQAGKAQAVKVAFTAGYGTTANPVPDDLKHAIRLVVGQMVRHREDMITGTIVAAIENGFKALIAPYRLFAF